MHACEWRKDEEDADEDPDVERLHVGHLRSQTPDRVEHGGEGEDGGDAEHHPAGHDVARHHEGHWNIDTLEPATS